MLKKLIKYDLLWVNKSMAIFFIISTILSTLNRIISNFSNSYMGNILYIITKGLTISFMVSILINCIIRLWRRFNSNIYKDESYLTHTLPIEKNTLFKSKMISSIISILISLFIILINIMIGFFDSSTFDKLINIFSDTKVLFIFINIIIISLLQVIYLFNCGILGLLIGNKSNNNKMVKSVFIGILLYCILQSIIVIVIYLVGLINSDIKVLFTTNINNDLDFVNAVKYFVIIVNCLYIVFISLIYFISKNIFKKGINVD